MIGCGAGITAGAVSIDPRVERETIVEIEPLVPQAASAYFSEPNFDVLHNPKVQVRIDDGRHYLLTTKERFDGITVDPLDPWVKGAANLYTQEFLEVMKQHLNRGGVVTHVHPVVRDRPGGGQELGRHILRSLSERHHLGQPIPGPRPRHGAAGPSGTAANRSRRDGATLRLSRRRAKWRSRSPEIGMNSPVDLFATYAGRRSDLTEWLRNVPINRDRNLRMQYLAGLGLNLDDAAAIYAGMLAYRRFPEDLFVSAEGRVDSLREAIRRQP